MVHLHIHLDVRASCYDGLEQIAPLVLSPRLAIHLAPLNVVPCRGKVSGGLTSREQGRVGVRVGGERSLDQTVEEQAAVA